MDSEKAIVSLGATISILFFLAYDIFIRLYSNTTITVLGQRVDAYLYGHYFSMIIACAIPLFVAKGKERAIAWASLSVMVLNYFDSYYCNPIAFGWNDLLLLPAIGVWLHAVVYNRAALTKYSIPLLMIIPVYLLTRNGIYYTDHVGIKYLMNIGDAAIFFLVAIYAGYKIHNKTPWIAFLFFMLCLSNLNDNTIYDPYTFGVNEMFFAGIVTIDAILLLLRKYTVKTEHARRLYRHVFIAVNVCLITAIFVLPISGLLHL